MDGWMPAGLLAPREPTSLRRSRKLLPPIPRRHLLSYSIISHSHADFDDRSSAWASRIGFGSLVSASPIPPWHGPVRPAENRAGGGGGRGAAFADADVRVSPASGGRSRGQYCLPRRGSEAGGRAECSNERGDWRREEESAHRCKSTSQQMNEGNVALICVYISSWCRFSEFYWLNWSRTYVFSLPFVCFGKINANSLRSYSA